MLCNVIEAMAGSDVESVVVSTTSSIDHYSLRGRIERSARFADLQVNSLLSPRFIASLWRQVRDGNPASKMLGLGNGIDTDRFHGLGFQTAMHTV